MDKDNEQEIYKIELKKQEELANKSYQEYKIHKRYVDILRKKIQDMCVHEYEIDYIQYDLDRTTYTCKKCNF